MDARMVSVIVPTFRRTRRLGQALVSLLQQDYRPLEIIVVDDNGESRWNRLVHDVLRESGVMQAEGVTLRLIVNARNLGSAASRNAGLRAAQGYFTTFLDDDDLYLPNKISAQAAHMLRSRADFCLMNLMLCKENGKQLRIKSHPYLLDNPPSSALIRLHLMHHLTGTSAMMFRHAYLQQIGGFGSIDIGDEFYLMMNALEAGGRFAYLPQTLVRACVHCDGTGLSGGPGKIEGEQQLYAFKQKYFPLLSRRDVCRIRVRHHAVLAYAYLRCGRVRFFLKEGASGFLVSPIACLSLLMHRRRA